MSTTFDPRRSSLDSAQETLLPPATALIRRRSTNGNIGFRGAHPIAAATIEKKVSYGIGGAGNIRTNPPNPHSHPQPQPQHPKKTSPNQSGPPEVFIPPLKVTCLPALPPSRPSHRPHLLHYQSEPHPEIGPSHQPARERTATPAPILTQQQGHTFFAQTPVFSRNLALSAAAAPYQACQGEPYQSRRR